MQNSTKTGANKSDHAKMMAAVFNSSTTTFAYAHLVSAGRTVNWLQIGALVSSHPTHTKLKIKAKFRAFLGEPCHNGGVCGDFGSRVECVCPPGFSGAGCQVRLALPYGDYDSVSQFTTKCCLFESAFMSENKFWQ